MGWGLGVVGKTGGVFELYCKLSNRGKNSEDDIML